MIKTDEDPAYISRILKYLKLKSEDVENSMSIKDPLKVAILSGFLIADELFKARSESDSAENREVERLTLQIIDRIDKSLTDN